MSASALPPASAPLAGRVLLVTGAGAGLGRATAIAAAKGGATVVLLGRTIKKLEATYDAIAEAGAAQAAIVPLNLNGASYLDYENLAETMARQYGRLDGLVHCAAHFTGFMRLAELPLKDWLDGLQINLTAAYSLSRACLPLLEASSAGRVLFVTDVAAKTPKAYQGIYGVSKAAIEALCSTWALETASTHPALKFSTFNPGPMRTGLRLKGWAGDVAEAIPPPEAAAQKLLASLWS